MLNKYLRLAHYHNRVVDKLCRVSLKLQINNKLLHSIHSEVMTQAIISFLGLQQYVKIEPEFTAENLKYVDIMPVLGIALQRIVAEHEDVVGHLNDDPLKLRDFLCNESPKYLYELEKALDATKIGRDELLSNIES